MLLGAQPIVIIVLLCYLIGQFKHKNTGATASEKSPLSPLLSTEIIVMGNIVLYMDFN